MFPARLAHAVWCCGTLTVILLLAAGCGVRSEHPASAPPAPPDPRDFDHTIVTSGTLLVSELSPIMVMVNAVPGSPLQSIGDRLTSGQTLENHADLLIVQGGKNNALYTNTAEGMRRTYREAVMRFKNHADLLGVPLFIQEMTPVIPEVQDERGNNSVQLVRNMQVGLQELHLLAEELSFHVIPIHDAFAPHYDNDTTASWCVNPVNGGRLDGSHLSRLGTEQLARAWWQAIADHVRASQQRPVRVAVYGDSISAATYLDENERPGYWLMRFAIYYAVTGSLDL